MERICEKGCMRVYLDIIEDEKTKTKRKYFIIGQAKPEKTLHKDEKGKLYYNDGETVTFYNIDNLDDLTSCLNKLQKDLAKVEKTKNEGG